MEDRLRPVRERVKHLDIRIVALLDKYAHQWHRFALGLLFIWLGLLKPLGHKTATSLLAETIYVGSPETMVVILGWWEVTIGLALLYKPFVRVALALLLLRIPGILLAFVMFPDTTFIRFPLVPTPHGQYLIKDLVIFLAALAVGGTIGGSNFDGN